MSAVEMDFAELSHRCAPLVHPTTMAAVASVESSFNPFSIGVVGASLARQPANMEEAVSTATALANGGYNFSMGIGQVNRFNLQKYALTYESAFDSCSNLAVASRILKDCFDRAKPTRQDEQAALRAALSCYYSGNFTTGFRAERDGSPAYVDKVVRAALPATNGPPARVAGRSPTGRGSAHSVIDFGQGPDSGVSVYDSHDNSLQVYAARDFITSNTASRPNPLLLTRLP